MSKKLISLLLCIMLVVTAAVVTVVSVSAESYDAVITVGDQQYGANIGDTFNYVVELKYPDANIKNFQGVLSFDDSVLSGEVFDMGDEDQMDEAFPVVGSDMVANLDNGNEYNIIFTKTSGYKFKTDGCVLMNIAFTVVGKGDVALDLYIVRLTAGSGATVTELINKGQVEREGAELTYYVTGADEYVPEETEAPTEAPATEAPTEAPATDAPTEAPATEAPTEDAPVIGGPTEAPATEAPTEAPATEAPTEAPATEAPTEAPATDAPTEAPATEAPTEAPATDAPTEAPATEAPTEAPATEAPTEAPATDAPTEAPATDAPTEAPATDAPTEAPATEVATTAPATEAATTAPAVKPTTKPNPTVKPAPATQAPAAETTVESDKTDSNANYAGGNPNAVQTGSTQAVVMFFSVLLMVAGVVVFARKKSSGK